MSQTRHAKRASARLYDGLSCATGFDFEPLPNGDVLIDFYGDDGVVFNSQIITRECLARIPVVAHALFVAVEEGKEAALVYLERQRIDCTKGT
jgi:hypothetical protein